MAALLVITIALALISGPPDSQAQQAGKLPRVGVLLGHDPGPSTHWDAFREGLREHGYVEGQNIVIDWRPTQGRAERLPNLAAELVRLKVDVIVAVDNPAIAAAQDASRTIPIVRQGKSLQFLKEASPHVSRVGILWDPTEPGLGREAPPSSTASLRQ